MKYSGMSFVTPVPVTDARLISTTAPASPEPEWAAGTTYALGAVVQRAATHRRYKSSLAGNAGAVPEDNPAKWTDIGPTNPHAMFDRAVGTRTVGIAALTVVIEPGEVVNTLALLEVEAEAIAVTMVVGGETVFTSSADMGDQTFIDNYYDWCFAPIERRTDLIVSGLPPYPGARITVTLTAASAASCGVFVMGRDFTVGALAWEAGLGINDYSRKKIDEEFGVVDLKERGFAKRMTLPVVIDTKRVDAVARALAGVRATPVVWIGSTRWSSLIVYGFYKDWSIDLANNVFSDASLTIEGMIDTRTTE